MVRFSNYEMKHLNNPNLNFINVRQAKLRLGLNGQTIFIPCDPEARIEAELTGQVPVGHDQRLEFGFSHQGTWTWR